MSETEKTDKQEPTHVRNLEVPPDRPEEGGGTESKPEEALSGPSPDELYKALAESARDIIFVIDRGGYVRHVNRFAAECFPELPGSLIGRHLSEMFPPDVYEAQKSFVRRVFESGQPCFTEDNFSFSDQGRWLDTRLVPVFDRQGGEVSYVLGIARDITHRKKTDSDMLKAEKLETLGVLAGAIAHEFNNILTAITGNLLLAKMYAKPDLEVYDILSEAEKAAQRAENLTGQLLTFSKGGALFKKVVQGRALVRSLVDSLSREGGVEIDVAIEDDLVPVNVDEGQIRQAINNLIINARQAMPEGGIVTLRAENTVSDGNTPLSMKSGRYLKISVEDQGPGINGTLMEKIFDPFFTTKKKSSGLGLTTAYSIVKNHEGCITVESSVGAGTSFHVYLPAVTDRMPLLADEERIFFSDRKKVLVMDDEEIVRTVLDRMLAQCGCETEFATDGLEMLRLYRQSMEAGRPFDAVIIDLVVTAGMGGRDAIRELLLVDPDARAIVSSGYSDDLIMSDYRTYGFRGVLAKPYKITRLSRVLREVMRGEEDPEQK